MRRPIAAALLLLLGTAFAARAQAWRSGIDSRIELMSILFRLAGNKEYHQCRIPAYDHAIDSYFAPYRDHQAVLSARSLGAAFDGPMKLAIYVQDVDSLEELVPFESLALPLYEGWDAAQASAFLSSARRFAADTNFQEFLRSQQTLYDTTNARLRASLDKSDLAWFTRFFGPPSPAGMVIVPGLANGAPSYAARIVDQAGQQTLYAIPGVSTVDPAGVPVFDSDWRTTMVHELALLLANPAGGKLAPRMEKAARQIYPPVAAAMQRQSYGNSRTMLNQSLARAATIEYLMDHDGAEAARLVIRQENACSFFWMSGLVNLLDTYRNSRQQYPTFESFMPRIAEFFDNVAATIDDLTDRYQPKVLTTSIPDGASAVDPSVKSIVVTFSMPMNRLGPGKTTKTSGGRFDATGTVLTIPVSLEPSRNYVFPLRWAGGQSFVSADGVPLPATLLRFRTGSADSPKKP